jgi:16S rRNA (cytosine967-C5)-methyltransferase
MSESTPRATLAPSNNSAPLQAPALWRLLISCASAVQAVEAGQSLTECLTSVSPTLKPGTQALAFTVMRRLGWANALLTALVPRKPSLEVRALLLTVFTLADDDSYTSHTLVNQAVQACKHISPGASGLVNAVLRRYLREKSQWDERLAQDPIAQWSHPDWWIKKLQHDWPDQWQAILHANNQPPPMTLRVNRRKTSRDTYLQQLTAADLSAQAVGEDGVVLQRAVPVQRLPGFAEGDISVQDAHAQLSASLLLGAGLHAGARVLDACSAPGGKTAHLLERIDAQVLAIDIDAKRLKRVDDNLARLGLQATTLAANAAQPSTWWDGQAFDAIVLDAPCSASGIVRRHPDVRWLRRPSDLDALSKLQHELLDALWPLLNPGGLMLYCTCSVFKQEGQEVIDAFMQRQRQAQALKAPGHLLPVVEYPIENHLQPAAGDGFFYALLQKAAA